MCGWIFQVAELKLKLKEIYPITWMDEHLQKTI